MPAAELSIRVPAKAEQMAPIRVELAEYGHWAGLAEADIEDAQTIVTETCGNSIRHGYGGSASGSMEVHANVEEGELCLLVRDFGSGVGPRIASPTSGLHAGISIIGALSRSFRLSSRRDWGTELEVRLLLAGPA